MTDNAPERIWVGKKYYQYHGTWWQSQPHHQMTEYIRLDLYTAVCAERDRFAERHERHLVLGAEVRARAEAAEAKVKALIEAGNRMADSIKSNYYDPGAATAWGAALQEKPHE